MDWRPPMKIRGKFCVVGALVLLSIFAIPVYGVTSNTSESVQTTAYTKIKCGFGSTNAQNPRIARPHFKIIKRNTNVDIHFFEKPSRIGYNNFVTGPGGEQPYLRRLRQAQAGDTVTVPWTWLGVLNFVYTSDKYPKGELVYVLGRDINGAFAVNPTFPGTPGFANYIWAIMRSGQGEIGAHVDLQSNWESARIFGAVDRNVSFSQLHQLKPGKAGDVGQGFILIRDRTLSQSTTARNQLTTLSMFSTNNIGCLAQIYSGT